jgi:uncharacterized protein with FMN-binding domain
MKRIVVAAMGTISALVLLFSYHTSLGSGTASASAGVDPNGTGGEDTSAAGSSPSPSPSVSPSVSASGSASSSSGSSSGSSSASGSSGTFTGEVAGTQWGDVEVRITVKDGKITQSEAVEYPDGNFRDQQINAYALPELNSEVVSAQSGSIDAVSGATVTSDGYIQSLQSAIDQAHLS